MLTVLKRTSGPAGFAGILLGAIVFAFVAAPSAAQTGADRLPSLNPMLERVTPGVVNISVRGTAPQPEHPLAQDPRLRRFFGLPEEMPERRFESAGSGVIIDAQDGLIVTNHHVVRHADEIFVVLKDRRRLEATVVGSDEATDIALLRVEADNLTAVPMGDSDELRVGDFVVAIGNPFGLGQTATIGIVSATGRTGIGSGGYQDFIQTDASINPGNSGGALVTQSGELVGINTAILSRTGGNIGIGFSVPINMVRNVVSEIREHGEVRRGQLGVYIQDLTPELADAMNVDSDHGAIVTRVIPGTPAAEADLRTGDVIVALDGEPVENGNDLRNRVGAMDPGDAVTLTLIRDGESMTVGATLAARQAEAAISSGQKGAADLPLLRGLDLRPLPEDHPMTGEEGGVLVAGVAEDAPAARAGLRPGDVIVEVNGTTVSKPEDIRRIALSGRENDGSLLLRVRRGEGGTFILLG